MGTEGGVRWRNAAVAATVGGLVLAGQAIVSALLDGRPTWQVVAMVAGTAAAATPLVWLGVSRYTRRNFRYEARIHRALELCDDEACVGTVTSRALAEVAPSCRSDLLLADLAGVRLRLADPGSDEPGCSVETPSACPAMRRGHVQTTRDSFTLDACPRLAGVPRCAAVCVPLTAQNRAVGVIRVLGNVDVAGVRLEDLECVAAAVASRIGLLRTVEQTRVQASYDPLTGLLNRRAALARLQELLASGDPFAVALCDLDHFKSLNDGHGHAAGDRALRLFAQVLRTLLRPGDVAARWGGEEFLLLLPGSSEHDAVPVLERVRGGLRDALAVAPALPVFTASFGVASSTLASDAEALVEAADQALYVAKRAGRDRVVVSPVPFSVQS